MIQTILKIEGMMCGMCEAHVNDAVRECVEVKKVTSSHTKGEAVIISKEPLVMEKIIAELKKYGYKVVSMSEAPYVRKSVFNLFGKK